MREPKRFELKREHIILARNLYIIDTDQGPEIDDKRPYGDSDIPMSIAETLEITPRLDEDGYPEHDFEQEMMAYHLEMPTALSIILAYAGEPKFLPGTYIDTADMYFRPKWELEQTNEADK